MQRFEAMSMQTTTKKPRLYTVCVSGQGMRYKGYSRPFAMDVFKHFVLTSKRSIQVFQDFDLIAEHNNKKEE